MQPPSRCRRAPDILHNKGNLVLLGPVYCIALVKAMGRQTQRDVNSGVDNFLGRIGGEYIRQGIAKFKTTGPILISSSGKQRSSRPSTQRLNPKLSKGTGRR